MKNTPAIFNGPATKTPRKWFEIRNQADMSKPAEVLIYDDIGETEDWWTGETSGVGAQKLIDQLKALGDERQIILGINSRGGNVWDGMAIYNYIRRRGNVDTRNDGLAASIASLILIGGRKVYAPKASQVMIHDPSTVAYGGEEEMDKAKQALASSKRTLIAAYKEKTGKSDDEIASKMKAETWFSGEDAKEFGFIDELTEAQPIFNSLDLSCFKRVPEALRNNKTSAAKSGGAKESKVMDRTEMIALLKERGIQVNDSITDADLKAKFKEVFNSAASTQTATATTAAATQTAAAAGASTPNADVTNRLAQIEAKYEAERKQRITGAIDNAISDRRIVAAQRDNWIRRALADETVLTDIANMPQQLPPEGVSASVEITSEAPADILKGIGSLREPIKAMLRGNEPDARVISNNARRSYAHVIKNLDKLRFHIQNAHSIDSDLKQHVIMAEGMRAFKRMILPLTAFSTVFNNVALKGTSKVQVPYLPLFTTASTDFDQNNGYVFSEASVTQAKEVEVTERKYQPFQFNSSDLNRQPYFNISNLFLLQVEQLGVDVVTDVLSEVTAANFGAAIFAQAADAFDTQDVQGFKTIADRAFWRQTGRSMLLETEYEGALAVILEKVNESGNDSALREGVVGRLKGFDVYSNATIPDNGENLKGFINLPSALLVATSPIIPAKGVQKNLVAYDMVIDPDTGASFEYRYWGNPDKDQDREVVECNYGFETGEAAALKRICTAS